MSFRQSFKQDGLGIVSFSAGGHSNSFHRNSSDRAIHQVNCSHCTADVMNSVQNKGVYSPVPAYLRFKVLTLLNCGHLGIECIQCSLCVQAAKQRMISRLYSWLKTNKPVQRIYIHYAIQDKGTFSVWQFTYFLNTC